MSRWDAPSDVDYHDEVNPPERERIERSCTRCNGSVWVGAWEPYLVQVFCDHCWHEAMLTQNQKMDEQQKKGAA